MNTREFTTLEALREAAPHEVSQSMSAWHPAAQMFGTSSLSTERQDVPGSQSVSSMQAYEWQAGAVGPVDSPVVGAASTLTASPVELSPCIVSSLWVVPPGGSSRVEHAAASAIANSARRCTAPL